MTNAVPAPPPLNDLARDFTWGSVPTDPVPPGATAPPPELHAVPSLGPLANLVGRTFHGRGFNTIFRPQNIGKSPTTLPRPADSTAPNNNPDNVLELNLTEETLEFSSALGAIPNRGSVQGDIMLNGISYVQRVKDVTNAGRSVDIHFEPGVWLSIPPTDDPEVKTPTVARMASIPHGTTVEAQGTFLTAPQPIIDPVSITPFLIGQPPKPGITFASQNVDDNATFRIPQDLSPFIADGSITKEILLDPNKILRDRLANQHITTTDVIFIDTDLSAPVLKMPADPAIVGGGTDNIAFLKGAANGPNADAVQMGAIFWVETVADTITVPALGPGESVTITGTDSAGDGLVPSFTVSASSPIADGTAIDVTYTQVQYTQLVNLNFAGLTWPHVSVATLIPRDPVPVPR